MFEKLIVKSIFLAIALSIPSGPPKIKFILLKLSSSSFWIRWANSIEVNSIILEAQKKKIRTVNDLNQAVKQVLNSSQKTILLVIYNSQNQRRYIGVKLD